jgi:hypothetical protein
VGKNYQALSDNSRRFILSLAKIPGLFPGPNWGGLKKDRYCQGVKNWGKMKKFFHFFTGMRRN